MYVAVKQFDSFREAIEGIFLSKSLEQSDLKMFLGEEVTDFKSMNECVEKIHEEKKGDQSDTINFPEMWDDTFSYTTYSGTNSVRLSELRNESGEIEGYLCEYCVESSKPFEYSSAMREFREAGWSCCEDLEKTPEEIEQEKNEYEQNLIEDMRTFRKIPEIGFSVEFLDEEPAYIAGHYIGSNPYTIQTLLQNHPELAEEVIEIIDEQIAEIQNVEVPTTYDFNEAVYEDSNFYVDKKNEVLQTLTTIRDELLKEKLASKESELSSLEEEEKVISEAEQLIDKQTVKEGEEVGEE